MRRLTAQGGWSEFDGIPQSVPHGPSEVVSGQIASGEVSSAVPITEINTTRCAVSLERGASFHPMARQSECNQLSSHVLTVWSV